jgi:hypothetical protein
MSPLVLILILLLLFGGGGGYYAYGPYGGIGIGGIVLIILLVGAHWAAVGLTREVDAGREEFLGHSAEKNNHG